MYNTVFAVWFLCWIGHWSACAILGPTQSKKVDVIADASNVVSLVFSFFIAIAATKTWWYWSGGCSDPYIFEPETYFTLAASLGYFIWDVMICLMFRKTMGNDILFHSILCCSVFVVSLQPFMMFHANSFLLFEWSTPFLKMYRLGQGRGSSIQCQLACLAAFAITFVVFRILWGSYFVFLHVLPLVYEWYYVRNQMSTMLAAWTTMSVLGSVGLNYVWFAKIYRSWLKMVM
jgi:hypothetical protein